MDVTFVKGKVHECCEKLENLEKQDTGRPDLIVEICKVCGRTHRTLRVDPKKFNLVMR